MPAEIVLRREIGSKHNSKRSSNDMRRMCGQWLHPKSGNMSLGLLRAGRRPSPQHIKAGLLSQPTETRCAFPAVVRLMADGSIPGPVVASLCPQEILFDVSQREPCWPPFRRIHDSDGQRRRDAGVMNTRGSIQRETRGCCLMLEDPKEEGGGGVENSSSGQPHGSGLRQVGGLQKFNLADFNDAGVQEGPEVFTVRKRVK